MKKICVLGMLFIASFGFSQQTKKDKIVEIMSITGAGNIGEQIAKQMLNHMKRAYTNVPEEAWLEFEKEIKEDKLIKMLVPIYERHFSEKEIDDVLAFYKTETGKKFV